jgi:hypothetical protein
MKRPVAALGVLWATGCAPAEQPPYWELIVASGSPYEMGVQQGEAVGSKIRSLYTQLLTNSLIPKLNRDRADIGAVLLRYLDRRYDDGEFAQRLLLESAQSLLPSIPEAYVAEMQGIADGAGMPFEEILILNTFVDTVLSVRAVQHFLWSNGAPRLLSVRVDAGLEADGVDNDGDGTADEAEEGRLDPYDPTDHAALVAVPTTVRLGLVLADPDGVDPETVRIHVGERTYQSGDPRFAANVAGAEGEQLDVTVELEPLPEASVVAVQIQAGDRALVTDPPPVHAHFMRDQWLALATVGLDGAPATLQNRGRRDDRLPPPSVAFAARGDMTRDHEPLVAHHFALLDAGTIHKHGMVLVHLPDEGIPHVTVGVTGVLWGTSGMNADGLVWAANVSDTLDNPLLDEFRRYLVAAALKAIGTPLGIMGREVLARDRTVDEAALRLESLPPTLGWNFLLADAEGGMAVLEVDGNYDEAAHGRVQRIAPLDVDTLGRALASTSPDDLRMAGHYQLNRDDIDTEVFGMQVRPQRHWSGMWHRSLRAFYLLGDALASRRGELDADVAEEILRQPELVDRRDSMNAVIYSPAAAQLRFALGEVPATDVRFRSVDLGALVAGGGAP